MSSTDLLQQIQQWYYDHCDGDWEHSYGVEITTMDNPGWDVSIDLWETDYEDLEYKEAFEGPRTPEFDLPVNNYDAQFEWYEIWTEKKMFRAYCSPMKLSYVLQRFLELVSQPPPVR